MPVALLVAYHFPPLLESSGIHRTLAFSRYLQDFGWKAKVLTISTRAYHTTLIEETKRLPEHVEVFRAPGVDAKRYFSIGGHYPKFLAVPDRWQTWFFGGVFYGVRIILKYQPKVIFSTFPIATAHLIGLVVSRLTSTPWVADFRDPMAQINYPKDKTIWKSYRWIEEMVFKHASAIVVTTSGTARFYREKYGSLADTKLRIIENGFDEDAFASVQVKKSNRHYLVTLLHSGVIYPRERDPTALFKALRDLKKTGVIAAEKFCLILRATGYDSLLGKQIKEFKINDIVTILPSTSYEVALEEMFDVDGLVVLQGASCNSQIPAKVYEYLYTKKPVLGLTDPLGDTGRLLSEYGVPHIIPLEDSHAIREALTDFIRDIHSDLSRVNSGKSIQNLSRRSRTRELVSLFNEIVTNKSNN
jgi:glycosyltransferase involved in cell wall biosynthesis